MADIRRYLAQSVLYTAFLLPLVYFTHLPTYRHLGPDLAVLKIAIRHAGEIIGECTTLTAEQTAALPPNMRHAQDCPRERSPLKLELLLDGKSLYSATVPPSGLHNDGISSMYRRLAVPAGKHRLVLRMNDDVATQGYNWQLEESIDLQPAQVMVASFKEGFKLE
ncbi:MAG: hypothetical protein KDI01_10930 [Halioglobus sp.]|nr:hypothetical protein [Halioglobus sp.]